jgi:hypothetical protein
MKLAVIFVALLVNSTAAEAQPITAAGQPAQLDVRAAGERSIRVMLKPLSVKEDFPVNPAVASRPYPAPALRLREITRPVRKTIGALTIDIRPNPLTLTVKNSAGRTVQELVFETDGNLSFKLDEHPVLGMGEGGPRPQPGTPWREQPVQFDRRGQLDTMQPRWQADMYGSRNPSAMLLGTNGWGMFVAAPWGQIDLRTADRGRFLPWKPTDADRAPQTERNQQQNLAKGLPPPDAVIPGLYDVFIFDAQDPAKAMKDFSAITGPAVLPPIWALGYMQSHRTLEDDAQMLGIVETFRRKNIPLDAVIYLGTGFIPRGWNTRQPSFDFNPDVFKRDPKAVVADLHARNVKVVVHMVPWDRDKLPTLQGTIPARPEEVRAVREPRSGGGAPRPSRYRTSTITGSSMSRSSRAASTRSGPTKVTGSTSSSASSGISSITRGTCRRSRTCARGACSGTVTRALRSGAGGYGRATPTARGRRSRRR